MHNYDAQMAISLSARLFSASFPVPGIASSLVAAEQTCMRLAAASHSSGD